MKRHHLRIKETIATIISEKEFISIADRVVRQRRQEIEEYIATDPLFLTSLKPYDVAFNAPEIVKRMVEASQIVKVGPMASIAGAIASSAVEAMIEAGANYAVFDNGGDIAIFIDKPLVVGIYAGRTKIKELGMKVLPRDEIFGLCTSSATVGPSLSFGKADAATVLSNDVILADAAATALGNNITQKNDNSIKKSMKKLMVDGIEGMIAIIEDKIGMCGKLPQLVKANVDYDLISKG